MPEVLHHGQCGSISCLVLQELGPNLEDLLHFCGGRFSLQTCLNIALQILDRVEQLHSEGFVYRDIKPENFLVGASKGPQTNMIYMVDYGLAQSILDKTGKHVAFSNEKQMIGTARYMSVNAHTGKAQSRRDDLESLGYMLLYFLNGELPWQTITAPNVKDKYRKIKNSKLKHSPESLCQVSERAFIRNRDLLNKQFFFLEI